MSQRPPRIPLPDPHIRLTDEAQRLYCLAGWVGESIQDDYSISFSSVLIAFLLAGDRVSRWFSSFLDEGQRNRLLADKKLRPELLERGLEMDTLLLEHSSFRGGWSPSAEKVLHSAAELASGSPVGPEHVMAAYIQSPPAGHEEEYQRWGLARSEWQGAFEAQRFLPGNAGVAAIECSLLPDHRIPSKALEDVLRRAFGLRARRTDEQPWLSTLDVFFAVVEHGRSWHDSGRFLFECINGSPERREAYARFRGERYAKTAGVDASIPRTPVTPNVAALFKQAGELWEEVTGTGPMSLRHLVAAMLLHEASGESGCGRCFRQWGLDRRRLRERFFLEVCSDLREGATWDERSRWRPLLLPTSGEPAGRRARISADVLEEELSSLEHPESLDRLDFSPQASAFASFIASEELIPPIAIGVFGEWGTGKTFFMRLVESYVRRMQQAARQTSSGHSPYLSEIAHIHFNAWQYVESNLWASLAEHVFRSLGEDLSRNASGPSADGKLDLAQLETAREMKQQAEAEQEEARSVLEKAESELGKARMDHEKAASAHVELMWKGLQPTLDKPVREAVKELFGEDALTTASHLRAAYDDVRDASGRMRRLWNYVLVNPPSLGGVLTVLGVTVVMFIGVFLLPHLGDARAALAALGTTLIPVYGFISWLVPRLKQGADLLRVMEKGASKAGETISRAESEVAKARSQLEAARAALEAATTRAEEARQRVAVAEAAVSAPRTAERIARFIEERITSNEYRRELGVLHLVRRDFERLSRYILEHREGSRRQRPGGQPGLERIVLYIDDLDRCPPERVVQVIEAVHLLLAFKLFVVVVAVDARWVGEALSKKFGVLGDGQRPGSGATVHDYLEKIFQIPFWLPPMEAAGCKELIEDLCPSRASLAGTGSLRRSGQPGPLARPFSSPTGAGTSPERGAARASGLPAPPEVSMQSDALEIDDLEIQYMQGLVRLFPSSPRRVKRLLNTYRLLKACTTREEYTRFVHGERESGPYQAVITLLVCLMGAPRLSEEVLRRVGNGSKQGLDEFIRELERLDGVEPAERRQVVEAFRVYRKTRGINTLDELAEWGPRVARYSFHSPFSGGGR